MEDSTSRKNKLKIIVNPDNVPILYTDHITITANSDGVVVNAVQKITGSNEARIVSRIGMSREHAKKLIEKLGKILLMTENAKPGKMKN